MPNQPVPGDRAPSPHQPPREASSGEPVSDEPVSGRRPSGGISPHDALFRRIFGEPANMASQLRAVLPPRLTACLGLAELRPVPASFVDEALKWRHSDLLFTAPLDGRDAYVYLLAEHQSSNDPLMALRMLRYVIRIWDQHLRHHPDVRRLPAVIPLVVHHGTRRWSSPTQLLELIDADPATINEMEAHLPRFCYLLDDLARVDERHLRGRDLTPPAEIALVLLRIATGNPDISAGLRPWLGLLRTILDQPGGIDVFTAFLTYIERVSETPASHLEDLAASLGPEAEEAYMTTADMLRTEGRMEGRAEGRAEALVEMLAVKFGSLPDGVASAVRSATTGQLKTWTARAVSAETVEQVFD